MIDRKRTPSNYMRGYYIYRRGFRIMAILAVVATLILGGMGAYYKGKYVRAQEDAMILCELSNMQTELLQEIYPTFQESFNQDLEYLNLTIRLDVELPDKLDCVNLI